MLYNKSTLSNGLRIITVPMPSVASATVFVLVSAGSRYEEKEINGISHFLEHMAFKGTQKRPSALDIASIIDGIGGESNAFTSKDHTGYYIKAAKQHVPLLIDVLSDMLLHSKFDEREIEKEKGVIIEEINMYEDLPMRKIADIFENLVYGDTKLGRDIAGEEKVIRAITRQNFLDYVGKFYGPANTVIGIAGGIGQNETMNNDTILQLVEKHLGTWKKVAVQKFDGVDDTQKKPALMVKYKDTQQAHLCIGLRSFSLKDPNKYALSVLTGVLGGGMSSRLFIEVREKRGLAYYVRANNEQYQDVGNFVVQAGVDVDRIDDAVKVILEEFGKVVTEKVNDEELIKAKEYLKGRFILDLEDSKSVASLFASDELLEEEIKTPEEILGKIDMVSDEEVQKVAQMICKNQLLNLAVVGPYKDEAKFQKLLKL